MFCGISSVSTLFTQICRSEYIWKIITLSFYYGTVGGQGKNTSKDKIIKERKRITNWRKYIPNTRGKGDVGQYTVNLH